MEFKTQDWTVKFVLQQLATDDINLQPDFQRYYVWTKKVERLFIDSLLRGYAVPPIWTWTRTRTQSGDAADGYETQVIDGQQRLTCIRKFKAGEFSYKVDPKATHNKALCDSANNMMFEEFPKAARQAFLTAGICAVDVKTDDHDVVVDIFKRLNEGSTQLNKQEFRNAFYQPGLFHESVYSQGKSLKKDNWWGKKGSPFHVGDTDRMAAEKLISEIYAALMHPASGPLDKDELVDHCYTNYQSSWDDREVIENRFKYAKGLLKKIGVEAPRYCKTKSEVYTLSLLLDKFIQAGFRIGDRSTLGRKNMDRVINELREFADVYRGWLDKRSNLKGKPRKLADHEESGQALAHYYQSLNVSVHEKDQRQLRMFVLEEMIRPVLEKVKTDNKRSFSESQKDVLWTRARAPEYKPDGKCAECDQLFERRDVEFDHMQPHSEGGMTELSNGQVLCQPCHKTKSLAM